MRSEPRTIRSRHVVTPEGVRDAVVRIEAGRIAEVSEPRADERADVDLGGRWLIPGLVDTHVHLNDPGRAEWEGFETGTSAALAGGVTTVVDMPLNSIPTTTDVAGLNAKREAAAAAYCDVAFWGGVIPGNHHELEPLAAAGVRGFKTFLSPSGVDEFPHVSESDLERAMPIIAKLGLPLLVHAEWPERLRPPMVAAPGDERRYATWLATRPAVAEVEAVRRLIALSKQTGCRVHIVHLSSGEALPFIEAARARGVAVTAETCPHYLTFDSEAIPDGATDYKCAPPIRDASHREALWQGLERGAIDLIASDHSPCPPELKLPESGNFLGAWGGIASLELGLAAVWAGAHARGIAPERVIEWMSASPARLAGLAPGKGAIAVGADADLADWNPEIEWVVEGNLLLQHHRLSPYMGRQLRGRIIEVWLRGRTVLAGSHVIPVVRGDPVDDARRLR